MKVNEEKLKKASTADIIKEISLVDEELYGTMYLASYYRCRQLLDYKKQLEEELNGRESVDEI